MAALTSWDRAARLYDLQLWLERAALRTALKIARVDPDERLLDLGCGTGALLRELAGSPVRPEEAIGVDGSAQMLARVPRLPPGWRLVRADAAELPFPDRGFDVLTCAYLLHLLGPEQRADVLTEARRVLRPGGRLVAVTVAPPRSTRLARWVDRCFRATRVRGVLAGLRPLDPSADLEAAGFEPRASRRTHCGYPSLIVAAWLSTPSESSRPGEGRTRTTASEEEPA